MVKVREDLKGKRFGRLTVIEQVEDHICFPSGRHMAQWKCKCDCGSDDVITTHHSLKSGKTTSCGCVRNERVSQATKKYNKYDPPVDGIITGYTTNTNEPFYFNEEFFEVVKDICWHCSVNDGFKILQGYNPATKKTVVFHRYIGFSYFDHIDRNEFNNILSNLRPATAMENSRNRGLRKDNTSGIIGVVWHKHCQKWQSQIIYEKRNIYLGMFVNKTDAIKARLQAEHKYFGEFAPQKHLFEKYGITQQIDYEEGVKV